MALINVPDPGAKYTDEEIKALEEKINSIYSEAQSDIQKKLDNHTAKFQKKDAIYQKKLQDKEITQAEYDAWKKGQVFTGKQWAAKKQEITAVLNNSNKVAAAMINSSAIDVFGENANFLSYSLEHTAGVNLGFGLYNTEAVTKLIKDDPEVLPKWKIDQKKDYTWNQQNLNRSLTQGIIQGESLDKISKRVSTSLAGSNKNLMKTFAKTGMTQAQNSGRMTQLERAKALGLNVKKKWVATLDARTRTAHQELDGQTVDLDKPFKAEGYTIRYPGDPEAHPSLVYNCRCALTGDLVDYPSTYERYDNIAGKPIKNMTYKQWKASKSKPSKAASMPSILSNWSKNLIAVNNVNKGINKIADVYNISQTAAKTALDQRMVSIVNNSNVSMGVTKEGIMQALNDGTFKNVFETGISTFNTNTSFRRQAEEMMFGITSDYKAKDKPIYAMLTPSMNNDYYLQKPISKYSEGIFVVFDKSAIAEASTLTCGDSLNYAGRIGVTSLANPEYVGTYNLSATTKLMEGQDVAEIGDSLDHYFEVQLHGAESHSTKNIAYIVANMSKVDEEFIDELERRGLKVQRINKG